MAFWSNGLTGNVPYPTSSGLYQPYLSLGITQYSMQTPVIVDSYSLNPNIASGGVYSILLNTFSLGTQLYLEFHPEVQEYANILPIIPYTTKTMRHGYRPYLKSGNTKTYLTTGLVTNYNLDEYITDYPAGSVWAGGTVPGGLDFNIYGCNYAKSGGNPTTGAAYPIGKAGGGLTNQIVTYADSTGISFYGIGFNSSFEQGGVTYEFNSPVTLMFKIPSSILNDPNLFDPTRDGYIPEDDDIIPGEGGGVPKLPVIKNPSGTDGDFPPLPTGSNAFGFNRLTLFKPTDANLSDALDILYSDSTETTLETIIESCKKWWYKPEQYCISLMLSPLNVTTSASKNIKFGKYDSQVSCPFVTNQWHITDCGTINVPLSYGSYVDFEPYCKVKIFLPFVGFRTINANEVIGSTIYIKYYSDLLTGASVCLIKISRVGSNTSIMYSFECNLNIQVPLTSENYNQVINSFLRAGVQAAISTAGAASGVIPSNIAKFNGLSTAGSSAAEGISSTGSPDLTQSGNLTSNTGVLSGGKPFICVERAVPTSPSNYANEKGRPSNVYMNIGRCKGRTFINDLHVDIPGATQEELDAIKAYFRNGVMV